MVKPAVCLSLLAAVALAANHAPRHEGHDHGNTSVAAAETGAGHDHHEESSATEAGEAAEPTGHNHEDQDETDTSSPAESTSADADSGASTMGLAWPLAVSLAAYVGYLA